jgi:hypothetical protein
MYFEECPEPNKLFICDKLLEIEELYLCCQIVNKVIKREEESTQPQAKVCF